MTSLARCWYSPLAAAVLVWLSSFWLVETVFAQQTKTLHSASPQKLQAGPVKPSAPLRVTAKIAVRPKSYKSVCPATFVFSGEIKANRSATVEYRFVRSDGSRSVSSTLSFFEPGAQTVTDTWQLGDTSLPAYEGWEAIEIISPVEAESSKATFRMECRQAGQSAGRCKGR